MPKYLPDVFDVGVVGEAEETIKVILENKLQNIENIEGIVYNKDGKTIATPRRKLIDPLDMIPYPARDLFNMEKDYLVPRRAGTAQKLSRATHMFTSRGCPYNCRFCSSSLFCTT